MLKLANEHLLVKKFYRLANAHHEKTEMRKKKGGEEGRGGKERKGEGRDSHAFNSGQLESSALSIGLLNHQNVLKPILAYLGA
jgi:hypothetical protein